MSDTTPALAANNATQPNMLSLGDLTVIGVMRAHDGPAALLRSARGQVARVQTGAEVFGVTVTAINDTQVMVTNWRGKTSALTVAGS